MADPARAPAPVYGPGREYAAQRAIALLRKWRALKDEHCLGWSDHDNPQIREQYEIAKANRDQYHEYGPSYDE
ncbi:hypothetical protein SEA_JINKIES_65 [Arthrobacter phage Jinkies]|uniref:Uncharacterized protein n=1 Tax=Arthrobacter phage Jinkies TaxID=2743903 RepID=A0A7T0NBQ6_9CAUD|nr:hypothetical protein SEA_JINKIES_65 [Arthrobacter phage Jinkies]